MRYLFPPSFSALGSWAAEKLRALLQQSIRNRTREQDLLDIAVILRTHAELNRGHIADFLKQKAAARDVPISRSAFRSQALADRARQDYESLRQTTRTMFIPFEEALQILYQLVDSLEGIPKD